MRPRAPAVKVRPRVQFQKRRKMATTSQTFPIRSAPDSPEVASAPALSIPGLFTSQPILRDPLETSTSRIQDETVKECLPYLRGNSTRLDYNRHGVPTLTREKHKNFLKNLRKLPAPYIAADASRPWMLLWNLAGLALLDEDISAYGPVLVDTAHTMQNKSGGFGGGHGQTSHLATTFACVLALSCCGTQEAYDVIDRRSMWKWLCSLKQPNGGFQITYGGEVDVRGAYCAAVIITLLNIPIGLSPDSPAWTPERPTLFTGLAEYVRRWCLSILDAPHRIIPKPSDSYHTYYVLAGLSSAQHNWQLKEDPSVLDSATGQPSLSWTVSPTVPGEQIFDEKDRLLATHPIYTVPQQKVDAIMEYFASKPGF
ncbi:unnamed protein product [Parascedosporium putredinis]|uniref:Prenyltransferase alpha-alpha toroid domain-containing protein n=1 Tax=Parascedosporium putredinis TaxID=1442378 RepID=A0A9P1MGK6_9PEZI|nr:unnamed protein product [Parascedosporium putredinis]CAI8004659.1 unnamed protein product [Parascedosporium putredinis]